MIRLKDLYHSKRGDINYVNIILLIVLIAILVSAYIFGIGVYKNFTLGHFAEGQAIKASEISDHEIHRSINEKAQELGIDMATFELSLQRTGSEMIISYKFQRPMGIPGMGDKTVSFGKTIRKPYGEIIHLEHKPEK
jgi:hypothetical protein